MQEIIFFLPGQGAETPGLGKNLLKKFPPSLEILKETEEIWGLSLKEVIFEERKEIFEIKYAQPVLCWYSYSLGLALKEKYKIKLLVPYSLGVFPSIALSSILPYRDVIKILKFNYEKVLELNLEGNLLYVSGYPIEEAKKNLKDVYFSSINHKLSYTLGGNPDKIKVASEFLKDKAFSIKVLPSPWPIHTPLLSEVSKLLNKEEKLWVNLKDGLIPIFSPINLKIIKRKEEGKAILSGVISRTMFFNSIIKKIEKEDLLFLEASESGFFQKIFKIHNRNIKVLRAIDEI